MARAKTSMELPNATTPPDVKDPATHDPVSATRAHACADPAGDFVSYPAGRWTWHVRQDWLHLTRATGLLDWLDLANNPQARLIKSNEGREIWRVNVGSNTIYAKITRPARYWGHLRRWVMGSDAARERRISEYAAANGVAAVTALAVAEAPVHKRDMDSILLTLGVPGARPLSERWAELDSHDTATRATKNAIIDAAAQLIVRAHLAGLVHADLHAGNVLIQPGSDGAFRALFVDLQDIRIARRVREIDLARNLAQFNQWFRVRGLLTDRVRFFKRYLHWYHLLARDPGLAPSRLDRAALLRDVAREAERHAEALYAKRDRRALRSGRYFRRIDLNGGWRGHVYLGSKESVAGSRASRVQMTAARWRDQLADPEALTHPDDPHDIIKKSASSLVCRARVALEGDSPLEVVVKRHRPRSLLKRLARSIRGSRAMAAWKRGNMLINRRIPTARPMAALEKRRYGFLVDSLFIAEAVEEALDLDTVLTVGTRGLKPEQLRRLKGELTDVLVDLFKRLREGRLAHRDLKAPNLLVQRGGDAALRVLLVDLDGLRRVRGGDPIGPQTDMLVRLNLSVDHCRRVTHTDRVRFLRQWMQNNGRIRNDWKQTLRQINEMSIGQRETRDAHRRKMLARYGRF